MNSYENNLFDHQESIQWSLQMVQKSIEGLATTFAIFKTTIKFISQYDMHESADRVISSIERTQIPFPSFDGPNYRDWKDEAKQFLNLEGTLESQISSLLHLSMDGKVFSLAKTLHVEYNNIKKSRQQILKMHVVYLI